MDRRGLFRRGAHRLLAAAERAIDSAAHRARRRLNRYTPTIVPYRGFGGPGGLRVWGRVLNPTRPRPSRPGDRWWHNARAMFRRFATIEVPFVELEIEVGGRVHAARTDEEGYFLLDLPAAPAGAADWVTAEVRVAGEDRKRYGTIRAPAPVLVPGPSARFGVISDIDDTVVPTGATRLASMLKTTLFGNARTRTPFAGVASFYAALVAGSGGGADNPVFYVSSSPWNLYDFLVEFMEVHGLPDGPILLRDLGIDEHQFVAGGHDEHKLAQIEAVLAANPQLPFVLVGDSGQRDPEIYAEVASRHGDRLEAIYVRDAGMEARRAEVRAISSGLGDTIPMLLVADTAAAARHAAAIGLIN